MAGHRLFSICCCCALSITIAIAIAIAIAVIVFVFVLVTTYSLYISVIVLCQLVIYELPRHKLIWTIWKVPMGPNIDPFLTIVLCKRWLLLCDACMCACVHFVDNCMYNMHVVVVTFYYYWIIERLGKCSLEWGKNCSNKSFCLFHLRLFLPLTQPPIPSIGLVCRKMFCKLNRKTKFLSNAKYECSFCFCLFRYVTHVLLIVQ